MHVGSTGQDANHTTRQRAMGLLEAAAGGGGDLSGSASSGGGTPGVEVMVTALDWVIVVFYVCFSVGVGLFAGRKSQGGKIEDYMLAGKGMNGLVQPSSRPATISTVNLLPLARPPLHGPHHTILYTWNYLDSQHRTSTCTRVESFRTALEQDII